MTSFRRLSVVIPVYNEMRTLPELLTRVKQAPTCGLALEIIAVDDGSLGAPPKASALSDAQIAGEILRLARNVGHQGAIAIGLARAAALKDLAACVVMDSDGEDIPAQIPLLVQKAELEQSKKIIFAQRKKRQESLFFRMGYFFYKKLFHFLTGQKINFGNYSIIPSLLMSKVVHQNNIWNHYSGGIIQSKIPFDKILLDRGNRYQGVSKMNFNNLILHGLSSIAVYFDYLSLKILRFSLFGILLCTISVLIVLFKKYVTDSAIPGWASSLLLIISGIILQLFSVTLIVLLMQLSSRKNINPPNPKVYIDFIE